MDGNNVVIESGCAQPRSDQSPMKMEISETVEQSPITVDSSNSLDNQSNISKNSHGFTAEMPHFHQTNESGNGLAHRASSDCTQPNPATGSKPTATVTCNVCQQVVIKSKFTLHHNRHQQRQMYPEKCGICPVPLFFKSPKALERHVQKCHQRNWSKTKECPICAKRFFSFEKWRIHMMSHKVKKSESCSAQQVFSQSPPMKMETSQTVEPIQITANSSKMLDNGKNQSNISEESNAFTSEVPHFHESLASVKGLAHHRASSNSVKGNPITDGKPKATITCNVCQQVVVISKFKWHHNRHQQSKMYPEKCDHCVVPICFRSAKVLESHIRKYHPDVQKTKQCPICEERFFSFRMWKIHMISHTVRNIKPKTVPSDRNHRCGICPDSLFTASEIGDHLKSMHSNSTLTLAPEATQLVSDSWRLSSSTTSTQSGLFGGDSTSYDSESTMNDVPVPPQTGIKEHQETPLGKKALLKMTKTERQLLRSVSCLECHRLLPSRLLQNHCTIRHRNVSDFECDQCEFGHSYFSSALQLKIHKHENHSAKQPDRVIKRPCQTQAGFQCPQCPKVFRMESVFNNHMTKHAPVEQRRRSGRGTAQSVKLSLPLDSKTGTGTQTDCNICGLAFGSSERYHNLRHKKTDKTCIACPICPQTWFRTSGIDRHMKSAHGVDAQMAPNVSFDDVYLPEQIVIKLERTNFGLEQPSLNYDEFEASVKTEIQEEFESDNYPVYPSPDSKNFDIDEKFPIHCAASQNVTESLPSQTSDDNLDFLMSSAIKSDTEKSAQAETINQLSNGQQTDFITRTDNTDQFSESRSLSRPCRLEEVTKSDPAIHDAQSNVTSNNQFCEEPQASDPIIVPENLTTKTEPPTAPSLNMHRCPICNVCTTNLVQHLLIHAQPETKFAACPFCSNPQTWFANAADLRAHLTQTHNNELQAVQSSSTETSSGALAQGPVLINLESRQKPKVAVTNIQSSGRTDESVQTKMEGVVSTMTKIRPTVTTKCAVRSLVSSGVMAGKSKCEICAMRVRCIPEHMHRHTKTDQRSIPCPICPQTWFCSEVSLENHLNFHTTRTLCGE